MSAEPHAHAPSVAPQVFISPQVSEGVSEVILKNEK